jgi:hypothetical protein
MSDIPDLTSDLRRLAQERQRLDGIKTAAVAGIRAIDSEIARRYRATADARYVSLDKQHGTLTMETNEGVTLSAEIPRKVKYDSNALLGVAIAMPLDQAQKIFKFELTVPENIYKGLAANPELLAKIDAARTVSYDDMKITIKTKE